jgi:hypothetical protein
MDCLIRRKVWRCVQRSSLQVDDHVFTTSFHYKIRENGWTDKQMMIKKDYPRSVDFEDSSDDDKKGRFALGRLWGQFGTSHQRPVLVIATRHEMCTDHVSISQAACHSDRMTGDGHNGKVYIYESPTHHDTTILNTTESGHEDYR